MLLKNAFPASCCGYAGASIFPFLSLPSRSLRANSQAETQQACVASQLPHGQLPQIQGCKQQSSLISPFPWFKDLGRGLTGSAAQRLTGRTSRSRPAGAEDPSEALVQVHGLLAELGFLQVKDRGSHVPKDRGTGDSSQQPEATLRSLPGIPRHWQFAARLLASSRPAGDAVSLHSLLISRKAQALAQGLT